MHHWTLHLLRTLREMEASPPPVQQSSDPRASPSSGLPVSTPKWLSGSETCQNPTNMFFSVGLLSTLMFSLAQKMIILSFLGA